MSRARRAAAWALALGLARGAWAGAGKTGFEFLTEPPGARSAAMGGAATSVADDAEMSLWNPAALAEMRQRQLSVSYASYFDGMAQGGLVYGHPLGAGALGFGLRTQDSGDIPAYDAFDGGAGPYDATDMVVSGGYARVHGPWRWGVNLKQVGQSLAGRSARVVAADAGALWRPGAWPLTFSGALRNAGGTASFGGAGTALPRSLDLGANARFLGESVMLALESRQGADGEGTLVGGVEGWLYNAVALRAGWASGDRTGSGISMGLGIKLRELRVDYAFASNGDGFSTTHRMGVSWRFGGAGERVYQEGLTLLQKGRTAEAVLKFQQALDADPGHVRAVRALREAVRRLNEEMREDALPERDR